MSKYFSKINENKSRVVISGFSMLAKNNSDRFVESDINEICLNDADELQRIYENIKKLHPFVESDSMGLDLKNFLSRNINFLAYKALLDTCLGSIDPFRTDIIMGSRRGVLSGGIKSIIDSSLSNQISYYNSVPAVAISNMLGTSGYVYSSSITSIIHSIGSSFQRISDGKSDVALAGETDILSKTTYGIITGKEFFGMNRNIISDNPGKYQSKSLLKQPGDSGAVFIVEHLESAMSRGAVPYIEIESYSEVSITGSHEEQLNGGHAKYLISQILSGLTAVYLEESTSKFDPEEWPSYYKKNIKYERQGNKINKISISGLTGTGHYGNLKLKRFVL